MGIECERQRIEEKRTVRGRVFHHRQQGLCEPFKNGVLNTG